MIVLICKNGRSNSPRLPAGHGRGTEALNEVVARDRAPVRQAGRL
jgi:hypothetical protein